MRFLVKRADRACGDVNVGDVVYAGKDFYGVASDDTRETGIQYRAVSLSPDGVPFFTMPDADLQLIHGDQEAGAQVPGERTSIGTPD